MRGWWRVELYLKRCMNFVSHKYTPLRSSTYLTLEISQGFYQQSAQTKYFMAQRRKSAIRALRPFEKTASHSKYTPVVSPDRKLTLSVHT